MKRMKQEDTYMTDDDNDTAVISSYEKYTTFSFRGRTLTFRTCDGLVRYTRILKWDNGYIEVMASYSHEKEEIEEYIDLEPVLDYLYMDKEQFLSPIRKVRIEYRDEDNSSEHPSARNDTKN